MSVGERGRWRVAVILSLSIHLALFFVLKSVPERQLEENPVMSVRLVTLPGLHSSGGGGGGKPASQARAFSSQKSSLERAKSVKSVKAKTSPKIKKAAPVVKPKETQTITHAPAIKENSIRHEGDAVAPQTNILPDVQRGGENAEAGGDTGRGEGLGGGSGGGTGGGSGVGVGTGSGIANLSELEVLKKVTPEYPLFSRKRREEGTVVIIALVENGSVTSVELESSSGHSRLDDSAMRALKGWKFNSRGTIRVRVPFSFSINS